MPSRTTRGSGMDERRDAGRAARVRVPRRALGEWDASRRTHDALEVVLAQSHDRVPELVPIRHGRMAATPWTHYRGAAAVMAADLATAEHSALEVQLCGDAHILNFGLWATPERNLSYDLRDFDETLPGPFEWDVQRLAASLEVLAREVGLPDGAGAEAAVAMGEAYRLAMRRAASMGELEIWYDQVPLDRFVDFFVPEEREDIVRDISVEARRRTSRGAARKLVRVVDGAPRIVEDPPFRVRVDDPDERAGDAAIVDAYRATLPEYRRHLLDRFTVADVARQVVGVGSVGMQVFLVLFDGRNGDDPLFLQFKQAGPSVYEAHLGPSAHPNHGQRVVVGRQLMQSAGDIFTGWTHVDGGDVYVRQFRDMKVIPDPETIAPRLREFAVASGTVLARAHARTGDAVVIGAYLGRGDAFDRAMGRFAVAYADQNQRDHAALVAAVADGRVEAAAGW